MYTAKIREDCSQSYFVWKYNKSVKVSCVSFHTYVIVFISRLSTPSIHTLHMFVCYVVPGIRLRSHCELSCLVLMIILWGNLLPSPFHRLVKWGSDRFIHFPKIIQCLFPHARVVIVTYTSPVWCLGQVIYLLSKRLLNTQVDIQTHRHLEWVDKSVSYIICPHSFSQKVSKDYNPDVF